MKMTTTRLAQMIFYWIRLLQDFLNLFLCAFNMLLCRILYIKHILENILVVH